MSLTFSKSASCDAQEASESWIIFVEKNFASTFLSEISQKNFDGICQLQNIFP